MAIPSIIPALELTPITTTMHIKQWSQSKRGSHVEFTIVVQEPPTSKCKHPSVYTIRKRFSQFHSLHKNLRDMGFAVPDMPTVDLWTTVLIKFTHEPVLHKRQVQLQHFLDCVSHSPAIQATEQHQEFVRSDKTLLGYTSLSDIRIHPVHLVRHEHVS